MARKPQVTRTLTSTKVFLLCLNLETEEAENEVVILPRTYKDESAILKKVQEKWTDETKRPVHVVGTEIITKKYGMDEDKFAEIANVIE